MASYWSSAVVAPANDSYLTGCNDDDLEHPSCILTISETGVWDAIAALRIVISCLSLLGSSSIIGAVIKKREISHPKVHPIFSLAIADLLLSLLWILGGGMWLHGVKDRDWCFVISLLTVILVCVSVNLTAVYALITYSIVKKTDLNNLLSNIDLGSKYSWSSFRIIIAYSIAWGLPIVIVLILFGVVAGSTEIIQHVNSCSCWCVPTLGNIIPYAIHTEQGPADYVHDIRKLLVVYGLVFSLHFLIVFIILVSLYGKSLKWIKKLKDSYNPSQMSSMYGTGERGKRWALISKGESKAHQRVVYFLTAFIINGFFNFIFSFGVMVWEITKLESKEMINTTSDIRSSSFETFYSIFAILQAISITQQGFLNAIVYSWTRDDVMTMQGDNSGQQNMLIRSRGTTDGSSVSNDDHNIFNSVEYEKEEEAKKEEEWEQGKGVEDVNIQSHKQSLLL